MPATDSLPWWRILTTYLLPQWRSAVPLAALLLTGIALDLANPQILQVFIDDATSDAPVITLTHLAVIFIVIALASQAVKALAAYFSLDVGWSATNRLREDLALHCLRLDLAFLNTRTPGEFIERIDGDLTALSNFFSEFVIRILGNLLLLAGVLVLLWRAHGLMGLSLTLYALVTLAAMIALRHFAIKAGTNERQASAVNFGFLEERLVGLDDIRANGGGSFVMRRFTLIQRVLYHAGRRALILRSMSWSVTLMLFALGNVVVFGVSAYLFATHQVQIGTIYLFFQYNLMLQDPLEQITRQMQDFQKAAASIVRVREMLARRSRMRDGKRLLPVRPAGGLAVRFDHVSFAYDDEETPVLRDIHFSLKPGQVMGLLGRTGSGKTTISRLLFRLYDPTSGAVRVGGVKTTDLRIADLRRHVGMVTQDVQLFNASVRDNVTFFDDAISDKRILAVVQQLGLEGWMAKLPHGLDTMLAAGGGGLSAGEAQLLAFIRIFLRDPEVIVLDEPSSRLDPATERLIERGMAALLHGRTGIIIAHRLATVERADTILVLDGGHIVEYGPRATLARDPKSRYAALLEQGREEVLA
jgi:ATP-binding cassette, subfamily B, bacterial